MVRAAHDFFKRLSRVYERLAAFVDSPSRFSTTKWSPTAIASIAWWAAKADNILCLDRVRGTYLDPVLRHVSSRHSFGRNIRVLARKSSGALMVLYQAVAMSARSDHGRLGTPIPFWRPRGDATVLVGEGGVSQGAARGKSSHHVTRR